MTTVADADVTFNTVASTNSKSNGVLLDGVAGAFTVTNSLTITNPATDGFVVQNSPSLTVSVPLTTVTSAGQNGVVLKNNSVDATKVSLGQLTVTTDAGAGLVVANAGATVAGGTINATGGASIAANTADLNVVLASATSTDSTGNGLGLTDASGTVQIAATTVTSPTANGINAVSNAAGFSADFGVTNITGIKNGGIGVNITNPITPTPVTAYSFDSLLLTTLNGTGMLAKNGGTINFNSPASITAAGGAAIGFAGAPAGAVATLGAGGGQLTVPSLMTVSPRMASSSMLTLMTPSLVLQSSSASRNRFVA